MKPASLGAWSFRQTGISSGVIVYVLAGPNYVAKLDIIVPVRQSIITPLIFHLDKMTKI